MHFAGTLGSGTQLWVCIELLDIWFSSVLVFYAGSWRDHCPNPSCNIVP